MADVNWLNIGDSIKAGPVSEFLEGGVTSEWQQVVVPLEAFGSLDFTEMGSLVFNFYEKGEGVVYLDEIRFHLKP